MKLSSASNLNLAPLNMLHAAYKNISLLIEASSFAMFFQGLKKLMVKEVILQTEYRFIQTIILKHYQLSKHISVEN